MNKWGTLIAVVFALIGGVLMADDYPASVAIDQLIRNNGCVLTGNRVSLKHTIAEDAEGRIVIEAEDAGYLDLKEKAPSIGIDTNASNGAYIHYVEKAEYRFTVSTKRTYHTWYRIYFPIKASWNHDEKMDQKTHVVIDNPNTIEGGSWVWLKGPDYDLDAGEHSFSLNFHGGARMDKIVFSATAEFKPEGVGPDSHFSDAATEGAIESPGLVPDSVRSWDRLTWVSNVGGDALQIAYSRDLGKTWMPLPADGSLKDLQVVTNGYNGVKFKFALKAIKPGSIPMFQNVVLNFFGPEPLRLENEKLKFEFSSTGQILSMANLQTGVKQSADRMNSALVAVSCLQNKNIVEYLPTQVGKQEVNGRELTQQYFLADGKIEIWVSVKLDDSEVSRWRVKVINRSDAPVVHVDFPIINGVKVGSDPKNSYLYVSKFNGNLYRNPPTCATLFNELSSGAGMSLAMDWIDWWNESGGIYFAGYDPTFRGATVLLDKFDESSLKFRIKKFTCIKPQETWESCDMVLAFHKGDWHWAADRFREWVGATMKDVKLAGDLPRWIREEFDGWFTYTGMLFGTHGFSGAMVKALERNLRDTGLTALMANRQGFDCNIGWCGLCPEANNTWGGAEELRQGNEMVRERGGHTSFYINWNLWCAAYSKNKRIAGSSKTLYPKEGFLPSYDWYKQNCLIRPDGSIYGDTPADEIYWEDPMCHASTGWLDYKLRWVRRYVEDYMADGIYWDTMNGVYDQCYSLEHGHSDLGQLTVGTLKSLKDHAEAARKTNPDYYASSEGVGQYPEGQYAVYIADGNFTAYELMRYTFPEAIVVGGCWDCYSPKPEELKEWLNYEFLTGVRFMNPLYDDYSKRVVALRRAVKQLLYPAVYRDTVGMSLVLPEGYQKEQETVGGSTGFVYGEGTAQGGYLFSLGRKGVAARRFTLERMGTKCELITVLNTPLMAGGTIRIAKDFLAKVNAAWVFSFDGTMKRADCKETPEGYELAVPASEQSVLALIERCEPMLYGAADSYIVAGDSCPMSVKVLNLNSIPMKGRISIAADAGLSGGTAAFEVASGETVEKTLELKAAGDTKSDRYHFDCVAESEGVTGKRLNWIYVGPAIRPMIDEDTNGLAVVVTLENKSGGKVSGKCRFEGTEHLKATQAEYAFDVDPRQESKVVIPMQYAGLMEAPELVTVWLEYGGVKRKLVRQIQPMITNGGFELDYAGDGTPDFWMGYRPKGHTVYSAWQLDDKEKYEGKYSIRLLPGTGVISLNTRLWPGKTYKISAAIKREEPTDKVGLNWGGENLGSKGEAGKWQVFEGTIKPASDMSRNEDMAAAQINFYNYSNGKAWFDAIKIEIKQ